MTAAALPLLRERTALPLLVLEEVIEVVVGGGLVAAPEGAAPADVELPLLLVRVAPRDEDVDRRLDGVPPARCFLDG